MSSHSREPVEIEDCEVIAATSMALLIKFNGEKDKNTGLPYEIWIPRSQILDDSEVYDEGAHDTGKLVIPEWLANAKGLI